VSPPSALHKLHTQNPVQPAFFFPLLSKIELFTPVFLFPLVLKLTDRAGILTERMTQDTQKTLFIPALLTHSGPTSFFLVRSGVLVYRLGT
jgi:hypothetical protein